MPTLNDHISKTLAEFDEKFSVAVHGELGLCAFNLGITKSFLEQSLRSLAEIMAREMRMEKKKCLCGKILNEDDVNFSDDLIMHGKDKCFERNNSVEDVGYNQAIDDQSAKIEQFLNGVK